MIEQLRSVVAELNMEKVNTLREMRTLFEKYLKLEGEKQTQVSLTKEAQSQSEKLQTQNETYKKIIAKLERQMKAQTPLAPSAHRNGGNRSAFLSSSGFNLEQTSPGGGLGGSQLLGTHKRELTEETLISTENIEKIRLRYGLSNSGLTSGVPKPNS